MLQLARTLNSREHTEFCYFSHIDIEIYLFIYTDSNAFVSGSYKACRYECCKGFYRRIPLLFFCRRRSFFFLVLETNELASSCCPI